MSDLTISRQRLLRYMWLQDTPTTPAQIADEFDITPSTASYHLRHLEAAGLIRRTPGRYGRSGYGDPFTPPPRLARNPDLWQITDEGTKVAATLPEQAGRS